MAKIKITATVENGKTTLSMLEANKRLLKDALEVLRAINRLSAPDSEEKILSAEVALPLMGLLIHMGVIPKPGKPEDAQPAADAPPRDEPAAA